MECFHCLEAQVLLYSSHWDRAFDWSQSFLGHSFPYHYPRARRGDSLFSLWDLLSPSSADALCEHALDNRQSHFSSNYVWPVFSCFFSFHPACTRHAATRVMLQLKSCCNSSHAFHISFWRFKLSLEGSLMTSRPHSMVLISFFPCIFPLLASPNYHGSFLHFSHTPFTLPPIEHKSKNHLLGLFTSFSQTNNLISARWL